MGQARTDSILGRIQTFVNIVKLISLHFIIYGSHVGNRYMSVCNLVQVD